MKTTIGACLSVLLLFLCACNSAGTTSPSTAYKDSSENMLQHTEQPDSSFLQAARLIIPGISVGLTQLDENADSVVARLGKPDRSDAAMGKAWLVWTAGREQSARHETAVFTARRMGVGKEESRVQEIRITSPFFHTADSVQTGMSLVQIKQKLPGIKESVVQSDAKPAVPTFYDDAPNGISFEINSSGICTAIIIHAKNKALAQVYVPLP